MRFFQYRLFFCFILTYLFSISLINFCIILINLNTILISLYFILINFCITLILFCIILNIFCIYLNIVLTFDCLNIFRWFRRRINITDSFSRSYLRRTYSIGHFVLIIFTFLIVISLLISIISLYMTSSDTLIWYSSGSISVNSWWFNYLIFINIRSFIILSFIYFWGFIISRRIHLFILIILFITNI